MGLGSSALLACGPTVPLFLARSANAAAQAKAKGRILVVVQLDGGNDGLNTVVPYNDDEYRKQRPRIQIGTTEVRKIDDHVGLNPALEGFSKLLEQQRLAIVQSVGYPNPNRSHFESMATWQTARLNPDKAAPGWLAQAIDKRPSPEGDAPGLHIHESFPLPGSLAGGRQVIPSLARLEQFRRRLGVPETADPAAQVEALDRLARQDRGAPGSLLQFVERSSLITYASSERLERVHHNKTSPASTYPEFYGLAQRLRLISQLIKAGLSTAIYYTSSTASIRIAASSSGIRSSCASWAHPSGRSWATWRNPASRSGCSSWSSPSSAEDWARMAAAVPTTAPRPPFSCWAGQ
jgi:hypothetical protein